MADEALLSFQSLSQSIPGWISQLETILTTAPQQQLELAAQHAAIHELGSSTTDQPARNITTFQFLRIGKRIRSKSPSVSSTAATSTGNEPSHRRRCLTTIYYDGNTQKRIETLVRAVGSSRNLIRKGKLGMKLDTLTRSDSSSSCDSSEGVETIKGLGTFSFRTTVRRQGYSINDTADTAIFDTIDSALDKAQLYCEKAAHQLLRQGDCAVDLAKARQFLERSIDTVQKEIPVLEKKAAKALQRRLAENEKYATVEGRTSPQHIDGHSLLSDGALEVDTDECTDSDDQDFDISAMRAPPRLSKHIGIGSRPEDTSIAVRAMA